MARSDAAPLITLSHRISREGVCAQSRDIPELQDRAIALVNAHRVPATVAESLISGVNALAAQTPVCLPAVPATTTTPVSTPAPAPRPAPHPHPEPRPPHHEPPHHEHHHGHGGHDH